MLDTAYGIETPEGVSLTVSPAGLVARILAWILDFLIRLVAYFALAIGVQALGDFGAGLYLVMIFVIEWFYPVLFEVYRQGQTPGKRQMGIRVLQDNGVPVGWSASLIRNLLRVVDFLPFLYGFGIFSMLISKDFKRLGDLAAGTLVVYQIPPRVPVAMPDMEAKPPSVQLHLEEQRAIVDFAERGPGLSPARAEELATILKPITRVEGEASMLTLYRIASWIQGHR